MSTNPESPFMVLLTERKKRPEEVAAALGVSERAVFYWLSGRRVPRLTIAQVQALCLLLECSVHDLPEQFGAVAAKPSEPLAEDLGGD